MRLELGARIDGRYELVLHVAEGRTSTIWAAGGAGPRVALKVARRAAHAPEEELELLWEPRAGPFFRHPNAVDVREVLRLDDGTPALVLELLSGLTLAQRLEREATLDLPELAAVLLEVVAVARAAHDRGIVHGDLKPANVFLATGAGGAPIVKVLDFGVEKRAVLLRRPEGTLALDASQHALETLSYLAPEVVEGEADIDFRADVWALGLIAYRALSGILPTAGDRPQQALEHVLHRPIWPLRDVAPDVPADVAEIVDRMLDRRRARRLSDLGEAAHVLGEHALRRVAGPRGALEPHLPADAGPEPRTPLATPSESTDQEPSSGASGRVAPRGAALAEGMVFADRFEVIRLIARGGMGAVYEVVHLETGRRRALKVLHPHLLEGSDARERFKQEARIAAHIDSDLVVDVLDAGYDARTEMPFLVMELLDGDDLGKRVRQRGPMAPDEALRHLHETAIALGHAHKASVIHRDIKPENLLLERRGGTERIKVLDFGIAKVIAEGATSASRTQSLGTPLYMAPEQFQSGGRLSPATDVFALGMVAYTLLVGHPYWYEEKLEGNVFALVAAAMHGPSEPARRRANRRGVDLAPGFDAWFARVTHEDPRRRPASAVEAIEELAATLGASPPRSAAAPRPVESGDHGRRGESAGAVSGASTSAPTVALLDGAPAPEGRGMGRLRAGALATTAAIAAGVLWVASSHGPAAPAPTTTAASVPTIAPAANAGQAPVASAPSASSSAPPAAAAGDAGAPAARAPAANGPPPRRGGAPSPSKPASVAAAPPSAAPEHPIDRDLYSPE